MKNRPKTGGTVAAWAWAVCGQSLRPRVNTCDEKSDAVDERRGQIADGFTCGPIKRIDIELPLPRKVPKR